MSSRAEASPEAIGAQRGSSRLTLTTVATYRASRELFWHLTLRELRSKYKRSFLGWAWSTVTPLATMGVYTIVFRAIIRIRVDPGHPSGLNVYALYLLCALLPWSFFQVSVQGGIGSLIGNGNLIKKTYFPREFLPAATVASTFVSHCIEMGLLLVALIAFGNYRALAFVPLVLILMLFVALFALGLGLMLSVLNVYFRDVEYLMTIVFLVWMYLTPVIYPFTLVPHRYQALFKVGNPMTDAVLAFRSMLYDGTMPGWLGFGYFALVATAVFSVGMYVFGRLEGRLAEEL